MSEYRCPECHQEESFTGYYSVPLDVDGGGNIDADSFDVSNAEFDSSYIMVCRECSHSDTASHFETDFLDIL